jgi:uncharacterized damage-inducible protein DinB
MKAYFEELAAYNIWANQRVISWLQQLSEEQWSMEITSSFSSIRDTTVHILGAEKAWLERLQKVENVIWLPAVFQGSKEETIVRWETASQQLADFIGNTPDNRYEEVIHFKRLNGDKHHLKIRECFAHVFNHSTYHRGQLVTMLRQAGFTALESTDLLQFYRQKQ